MATIYTTADQLPIDAHATNFTFDTIGNDIIYAMYLQGDYVIADAGDDTIFGNIGGDQLNGGLGNDQIFGRAGIDYIQGGDGNDILHGGDDQDVMAGDFGNDTVYGDAGNDQISDVDGTNTLDGGTGDDSVTGGNGSDTILGGDGNDNLYGEAGNDKIYGGAGDDIIHTKWTSSSAGSDYADGGTGVDTVDYSNLLYVVTKNGVASYGGVTVNLGLTTAQKIGGGGTDTILNFENVNGAAGDNNLTGSAGDNVINGNAGVDKLNGMGGNDTLSGGYSADTLNGGDGNDILSGGAGFVSYNKVLSGSGDVLTGGNGADTFVMDLQTNRVRMVINAGTDTITDFKSSEGDHINARGATFVGSSAFSHVLGHAEVQVTGSAAAQTVNLDFNGDGVTDSAFTVLNTNALTAADFIV
jgi:Ca2+-binding RTX toxin-like protein